MICLTVTGIKVHRLEIASVIHAVNLNDVCLCHAIKCSDASTSIETISKVALRVFLSMRISGGRILVKHQIFVFFINNGLNNENSLVTLLSMKGHI